MVGYSDVDWTFEDFALPPIITDYYRNVNPLVEGLGTEATIARFDIPLILDLNENSAENIGSIFLFPNPSNGQLFVNLEHILMEGPVDIVVYNAVGQIVQSRKKVSTSVCEMNIEDFSKGLYIVQVISDYSTTSVSFVKQ